MTKRALVSALKAFLAGAIATLGVQLSTGQPVDWKVLLGGAITGGIKFAWKYLDLMVGDEEPVAK